MRARKATFVKSASTPDGFPRPGPPEIAFAGRSNVGKSSLINTLTGARGLAKTSATPGRTRLINFFAVTPPSGPELVFVDLPGYGYAKVPKEMRQGFGPLIDAYIATRDALELVVIIVDARRGPEDEELDMVPWLEGHGKKPLVVLTKADKLTKAQRFPAAAAARKALGLKRDPLFFSATDVEGVAELWRAITAAVAPASKE
jgi:GTP-binding protein